MNRARILIVEDEVSMRRILCRLLEAAGHEVHEAEGLAGAREKIASEPLDIIITDHRLKSGSGLQVLAAAVEFDSTLPVIMITAYATVDFAVGAMKEGMFDFITKPFDPDTVLAAITRALRHARLLRENVRLKEEVLRLEFGETAFLGDSTVMHRLRETIARVAPTDATVLIMGETGTGKELVARLIHANSTRKANPFVVVNCAALPESLLESQLFGHEKGSFTGADRARQGLFEAADGGTLFLDEAGEMPLSLQAKLLRVLVDGEIVRVGSTAPRHVDVRILSATHRDLSALVKAGSFREDLYYRLAVVPVEVPPLRARREDIPELARYFLELVVEQLKAPRRPLSPQALRSLEQYEFPGNVRELRNLLERACILCRGEVITESDFPLGPTMDTRVSSQEQLHGPVSLTPDERTLRDALEQVEVSLLRNALAMSGGNQAKAARQLGISRSDMFYKLRKYADHIDVIAIQGDVEPT